MINLLRFCFLLIFLLFKATSIVDVKTYLGPLQNLSTSMLTNNGSIIYATCSNPLSLPYIGVYNVNMTTANIAYLRAYTDPNFLIRFNRLFKFNTYLISYATNNIYVDVFGLTGTTYYHNFTINQYLDQFYHASTKSIVLYFTVKHKLGYISDSLFTNTGQGIPIDQHFLMSSFATFSVADDQNHVAVAGDVSSALSTVYIYNLSSYSLICQYNLPISGVGDIDWMSDNQTLLIASSKNGFIIKLSIATCAGTQYSVTPAQTYKVVKILYYPVKNEVIFSGYIMSILTLNPYNYAIYSFSLNTNSITFLKNYTNNASWTSYNYETDNNNFFSISEANSVSFFQIIPDCTNGLIYNTSTYTCVQPNTTVLTTQFSNFQKFINGTLGNQVVKTVNLFPGSRKILKYLFIFFLNIDDLWLYNYHEREYDFPVNTVFNSVQQLQNEKWTLLQFQKIWFVLQLNSNSTIQQFSTKYNYSSWRFIQVEQNSNGFILNTLNFFCSNVLLIFIIFIILRVLFFVLFNYRISIIFRQYSFWFYLLMIILEGNVQYLTYLFSFQMKYFFSINFLNKMCLGISVNLYFIIFILAVAAFPIIKHQYGKFTSYFTQNLRVCKSSFVYMTFQSGYRNILLGFLHITLDSFYQLKIISLILTEIIFLLLTISLLSKEHLFINHYKVWLNIIVVFLRILIIFTFPLDINNLYTNIQYVHITIFYIYFSLTYLGILIQLIKMSIQAAHFIKKEKSRIQQQNNCSTLNNRKISKIKFIEQYFAQNQQKQTIKFSQKRKSNLILIQKLNEIEQINVIKIQAQPLQCKQKAPQPQIKTSLGLKKKNRLKIMLFARKASGSKNKTLSNISEILVK